MMESSYVANARIYFFLDEKIIIYMDCTLKLENA